MFFKRKETDESTVESRERTWTIEAPKADGWDMQE